MSDQHDDIHIDIVYQIKHYVRDPESFNKKNNLIEKILLFKLTDKNAWIRSVLIVANGRSLTTIIWWSSCIASIIWWNKDFFVASGVVPYCDGEFDVVELSLSVT